MAAKFCVWILAFSYVYFSSYALNQVGFIIKKKDEALVSIFENVLNTHQNGGSDPKSNIKILKEIIEKEDAASYHRAFCRLLTQGIVALLSPATESTFSILSEYSSEYQLPFITTDLPELASSLASPYALGIRPSTTRAILGLFQLYGWRNVVYLYDQQLGAEKLQMIFLLGYRALNLTLDGIMKVTSADEASWYLQLLDKSYDNKVFHVILDVHPNIARDIIRQHVHDIYVRKKNFHFVLSQPTHDDFWASDARAFGAVNVTTFVVTNQHFDREKSSVEAWMTDSGHDLNMLSYYYYDAALVLLQVVDKFSWGDYQVKQTNTSIEGRDCLEKNPTPIFNSATLLNAIKGINVKNGLTGRINFQNGQRNNFDLNVMQITSGGYYRIGTWSNGILRPESSFGKDSPKTLSLIGERKLKIVTKIKPPFMMWKKSENGTEYIGNDCFEGYLKDMIDLLAEEMNFEYDLKLVEDGLYGKFDEETKQWSGIIGDIIQGKADLAVADLAITGKRHRVVDFTDPYEMVGFSLVMKNPLSIPPTSSMFFLLAAFSADIWVCILISIIVFGILFHVITKFTGAPDSIESASGIWGRKHAMVVNAWFSLGSSMFQSTGVYPRSISSRVLTGVFWIFTFILSSLFIASIATQISTGKQLGDDNPQLSQLQQLSLETIMVESLSSGWAKIGIKSDSLVRNFIKMSNLTTFKKYAKYLETNPVVTFDTFEKGVGRIRESSGDYMALMESLTSEYVIRQKPCDILATHDSIPYTGYGLATPQGSALSSEVNIALNVIMGNGTLGSLHRKWWIDSSLCKDLREATIKERTIHVFTGLLCVSALGFLIVLVAFGIQYIRKNQNKESRRQQLSFEDMNLGQTFPQPPPELLAEPAPVLNLPEYDRKTLL